MHAALFILLRRSSCGNSGAALNKPVMSQRQPGGSNMPMSSTVRSLPLAVILAAILWAACLVASPALTYGQAPRTGAPRTGAPETDAVRPGGVLELRIGSETLRNPYWYADNGHQEESRQFWDKKQ